MTDKKVIGFAVYEYMGVEVFENQEDPVDVKALVPCTREELVQGESLITQSLSGFIRMQVDKDKDSYLLVSGGLVAPLRLNEDDRGCWVATSFINLAAVRKLCLSRQEKI